MAERKSAAGRRGGLSNWLLLACAMFSGCGSFSKEVYRGNPGEELPDASAATVELGSANWARFDQLRIDHAQFGSVKLHPGQVRIEWSRTFGVSVMVDSRGFVERRASVEMALEAGRVYRLQADRTFGPGYRIYMWIEDAGTGEVLAGEKKP